MTLFNQYALYLFFIILAFISRFYLLDLKPIHSDESVNGWFVMRIWETGFFKYDPSNYHGPLYFYLIHLAEAFLGKSLFSIRFIAALSSALTVVLLLNKSKYLWAAFFILFSPTMIFYGRSGIHESLFVLLQVMATISFIDFFKNQKVQSFYNLVSAIILMLAVKETVAIYVLSLLIPVTIFQFKNLKNIFISLKAQTQKENLFFPAISLLIFILAFSGGYKNPLGLIDFFKAFLPWLKTGTDQSGGHNKEFLYWLSLLVKGDYIVLILMSITTVVGLFYKNTVYRMVLIASWIQFLIYSLIPYKTPWCIIAMIPGFYIIFDDAFDYLKIFLNRWQMIFKGLMVLLAFSQIQDVYKLNFKVPFWESHPFVYVNSTSDLKKWTDSIIQTVEKYPEYKLETIQIANQESWPFPWLFQNVIKMDYFKFKDKIFQNALVYIIDPQDQELLNRQEFSKSYQSTQFQMRQSGPQVQLWIRQDFYHLMKEYLK